MIKGFIVSAALLAASSASALTFDNKVPSEIKGQMLDDLGFVQTLQGAGGSALHQQIFGAVGGDAYGKFFADRVKGVGMDDCGNGGAVACVIPYFDSSKIWLTENYIKFSHPQIARLMVVFHEARHTEAQNHNWPHATCPTPYVDESGQEIKSIWTGFSLAGQDGCDITPLGSYGSSMIMLKNVQKFCTNCTAKVKMDAGIYADDQYKRVIDANAKGQIWQDLYKP